MRFLLAFVAVLSVAAASKTKAPTLADLRAAFGDGNISEAHRVGAQVLAAHPDDAQAAYIYASTCMSMGLFDDGNAAIDRALAKHPKDADLHGARAEIAALAGDDATARKHAALALASDATQADALDVMKQLDVLDHYNQHSSPAPAPGSPSARVKELLDKLSSGASAGEIAPMFDPGILDNAPAGLPRGSDAMLAIVSGAIEAAKTQMADGNYAFVAYEVGTDAPGDVVPVQLLIENRWTAERVEMVKKLFADSQGQQVIDDETRAIFAGLDDADRNATFDRLVGSRRLALADLKVPVAKRGDSWVITDLELNAMSVRDQLLPMLPHLMDTTGMGAGGLGESDPLYTPHLPPIDYDSGSHFPTGALIGIIGGLVALVSTLARRR
jgi:tetratricopeptide (TPR) repeat protein